MLKVEEKAIEALQEAVEGECDGLAIDHKQAKAILAYVFPFLAHEVDQLRRTRDDLHKANNRYLHEALDARSKNAELEREVERLREALEAIDGLEVMEINPSNYTDEDVCELNNNATQAALIANAALHRPALSTSPQGGNP